MDGIVNRLYEAMFLVDSGEAASDWESVNEAIRKILDRNEARIVSLDKWDERKLAYEVKGKSRGTYILCYFRADGSRIAGIERDIRLSERFMRVLILRADQAAGEVIEKTAAATAEKVPSKAAQGDKDSGPNSVEPKK